MCVREKGRKNSSTEMMAIVIHILLHTQRHPSPLSRVYYHPPPPSTTHAHTHTPILSRVDTTVRLALQGKCVGPVLLFSYM